MPTSSETQYNNLLKEKANLENEHDNTVNLLNQLSETETALYADNGSTNKNNIHKIEELKKLYSNQLKVTSDNLMMIDRELRKDIEETSKSIQKYRNTLNNNNNLFKKYSDDIKNKMQLVATRDRMLQLSQERNIYKKKLIFVLFTIIIALLIVIIFTYTNYSKFNKN
jgi:Zn-dependent oligopeptidase